jgi:transcriptional regulator with XRE-family HTH domain
MNEDFVERLRRTFENETMADIARRIGVPHATIRNYFQGRLPAAEVLIKIADETGVSLNWLLTGRGDMWMPGGRAIDLDALIDDRITAIVERKLAGRDDIQELGRIDGKPAFDVASAVERLPDPHKIIKEWFKFEGRSAPADFGFVFFQGWESYSATEKTEAVRDAKRVLDRTLKNTSKK